MSCYTGMQTGRRAEARARLSRTQSPSPMYSPSPRAWDFLSLALAVIAADLAGHRTKSPDGWTREFELEVAVADPAFWNQHQDLVCRLLGFLTTDLWKVNFIAGGYSPKPPKETGAATRGLRQPAVGRS